MGVLADWDAEEQAIQATIDALRAENARLREAPDVICCPDCDGAGILQRDYEPDEECSFCDNRGYLRVISKDDARVKLAIAPEVARLREALEGIMKTYIGDGVMSDVAYAMFVEAKAALEGEK